MSATAQESRVANNPKWFRQVLGQYPTGVCVVTATPSEGPSAGMVVGSFTSVSLDPPLVAFLPDRSSSTWPRIQGAGKFCVNILGADQESICRNFASKAADKFEGQSYRMSALGSPILENAVAWMDCEIDSVTEAGDHYIVVGQVRDLQIERGGLPLLFFQGGYGRFSPLSLGAADPMGTITQQLRHVDVARPEMERIAADLSARCLATARVDKELVVAASAGELVGQIVANARKVAAADIGQILDIIGEHIAIGGNLDQIRAFAGVLDHNLIRGIDQVSVVAKTTDQRILAATTIE